MPKIELSNDTSNNALRVAVTLLRTLERRWRRTGRKRALYRYLAAVFELYTAWKCTSVQHHAAMRITKLTGLDDRQRRHPLRTIIDATSKADRRTKSRWTQALRFAWHQRRGKNELLACLRANGGVAGCASKWADRNAWKRTPAGCVRVGGEDRFPKVPLFIGVELINEYGNYL